MQLTVPGVPDVYQGTELWDFSLVDPDNRRPVDYSHRKKLLKQFKKEGFGEFTESWPSGLPKLGMVQRLLHFRREAPDLFAYGSYRPLELHGRHAQSVLAFAREYQDQRSITLVPRTARKVGWPCLGEAWEETAVMLPNNWANESWASVLEPKILFEPSGQLRVADLLSRLPVAVLRQV